MKSKAKKCDYCQNEFEFYIPNSKETQETKEFQEIITPKGQVIP